MAPWSECAPLGRAALSSWKQAIIINNAEIGGAAIMMTATTDKLLFALGNETWKEGSMDSHYNTHYIWLRFVPKLVHDK